MLPKAAEVWPF